MALPLVLLVVTMAAVNGGRQEGGEMQQHCTFSEYRRLDVMLLNLKIFQFIKDF